MQKKLEMHDNLQVLLPLHHGLLLTGVHDAVNTCSSVMHCLMLLDYQAARVTLF